MMNMTSSVQTIPNYPFILPMEANFDRDKTHVWVVNAFNVPVLSSVLYVIVLYGGQHWMKSRSPMELRKVLFLWNASLAAFSLAACARLLPELVHVLTNLGWEHSICSFSFYDDSPVSGMWAYLFTMSKLAELVDTLFLVLRKKKVGFLHWFHHCSVLVFTWFLLKDKAAIGRWFMNINAIIHCIMYTYYALMALHVKIPKPVALFITTSQISQMIFGSFVSLQGFVHWIKGDKCAISGTAAISAIVIYSAYLILFLNFFVRTYVISKPRLEKKMT